MISNDNDKWYKLTNTYLNYVKPKFAFIKLLVARFILASTSG